MKTQILKSLFACITIVAFSIYFVFTIKKAIEEEEIKKEQENTENNVVAAVIDEDNKAYFVSNGVLCEATLTEEGYIKKSDAKPVDAFNISYKEINKIMHALDSLLEDGEE